MFGLTYEDGRLNYPRFRQTEPEDRLHYYLKTADAILHSADENPAPPRPVFSEDFEHLRWFPLPDETRSIARPIP
jgi:hypothetical protein